MRKCMCCLVFTAIGTASAALPSDVIYRNDFTTRESVAAIPRVGETYEATPYPAKTSLLHAYLGVDSFNKYARPEFTPAGIWTYPDFSALYCVNAGDSRPSYDGWFQPNFSKGTATSADSLYRQRSGLYMDGDNPCFYFWYSTTTAKRGFAFHSLHNVFTNGLLKIQVDMRAPQWWATKSRQFWCYPVYDKYMDIEDWAGTDYSSADSPGKFGMRSGGSNLQRTFPQYYDVRKNLVDVTQKGNNYSGSGTSEKHVYWHRWEVTYDLDNARFFGRLSRITDWMGYSDWTNGTTFVERTRAIHPTFDTEFTYYNSFTNALWVNCSTNTDGSLATDMSSWWREKGGISGIGFYVGSTGGSSGLTLIGQTVNTNKLFADNLRVSWKAPGAEDFVVCYEDDFSNRFYRVLSPQTVSTTGSYSVETQVVDFVADSFTGYIAGNDKSAYEAGYKELDFIGTAKSPYGTTVQPAGVDAWRRLIPYTSDVNGRPWVRNGYDSGTGGNLMEIGQSGNYACIAQTLGTNIVSGKVRIVADAYLPNRKNDWGVLSSKRSRMAIALGTPALYSSVTADIPTNTLAATGIYREIVDGTEIDEETGVQTAVKLTNDVVFVRDAENTVRDVELAEGTVIARSSWYRLELVADVDARTYDMSITPLGTLSVGPDFVPTNDVLYAESDIPFYGSNTNGIGTFYLWGYGYGGTPGSSKSWRTCFDNIQAWNIVTNGEATVTNLVYSNDFSKRIRIFANSRRASGRLAYQYDRDDGPDHWIRQNGTGPGYGGCTATVRDDNGNQFLSLGRESGDGHQTCYTTSLGQSVDHGILTISADIRPPQYWFGRAGGSVAVSLGNKLMEQNAVKDFAAGHLLRFGFRDSTSSGNGGRYTDIRPFVLCSPDGIAVGKETGSYTYLGDAVSGSAQKWYRFIIKANLDTSTFDATVYDMGTGHPERGSSPAAVIGSATGLSLMNPPVDGLSSLDVACYGVTSTFGETGVDPFHALIDNIEIRRKAGFSIIMR